MRDLRRGVALFAHDMRESIPLTVTVTLAVLAFVFALLVATGIVVNVIFGAWEMVS